MYISNIIKKIFILIWVIMISVFTVIFSKNIILIIALGVLVGIFISEILDFAKKQEINIVRNDPVVKMPTKRDEDGWYDLYANISPSDWIRIEPHTVKLIPTGIRTSFDKSYRAVIGERGSNTKWGGIVMAGKIDSGYRGEWFVAIYNSNNKPISIVNENNKGIWSRAADAKITETDEMIIIPSNIAICQFSIENVPSVAVKERTITWLNNQPSVRGNGALGSSGK